MVTILNLIFRLIWLCCENYFRRKKVLTTLALGSDPEQALDEPCQLYHIPSLTVERHEVRVIRRGRGALRIQCRECGGEAPLVTVEEATVLIGISSRAIYRLVEGGRLHFTETADGGVLVCLASLSAIAD